MTLSTVLWMTPWDAADPRWIQILDPQSYGHFEDEATKHITWCDDGHCVTRFELGQAACLMEIATRWATLSDSHKGWEHVVKMLDRNTRVKMSHIGLGVEEPSNAGVGSTLEGELEGWN
jgi:hypothetical protein